MVWAPAYYVTPEELADYVRTDVETDRPELTLACTAAARAIDRAALRQFGVTDAPEARYFTPKWSTLRGQWVIECDDLFAAPTAIAIDTANDGTYSTSVDLSTIIMLEPNAVAKGKPYGAVALRSGVSVFRPLGYESARLTAVWGWTTGIPAVVKEASRVQGSRFFKRRDSPFGIAGSPEQGSELRLLARLDPDVALMIKTVRRDFWFA